MEVGDIVQVKLADGRFDCAYGVIVTICSPDCIYVNWIVAPDIPEFNDCRYKHAQGDMFLQQKHLEVIAKVEVS